MGKVTSEEMQGLMYGNSNNTARSGGSSPKKVSANEMENLMAPYRSQEIKHTVLSPSTQPTQAAPAGASSRKQSETMKQNVDTLKKQRDDALIKAGAYHRAGMKQEEAEQLDIVNRIYTDSVNAESKYKTQKNIEATEDYDPSKNKFKAGTAAWASLQDFGQSFMQGAGVLSHYLGDGEAAYRQAATSAKNLMDNGVSQKEALEASGVVKKDAAPITDYKTVAELKREKDRASVGTLEGLGLDAVGTVAGMAIPAAVTAITKSPEAGLSLMAVSSLGHKYADAYEKYGNGDLAFVLGLGAGAATYTTEQIGGVFGRLGGTKLGQAATKKLMSEAPGIYALATSTGGKWLRDALSEGVEEGAEDLVNYAVEKSLTGESDEMDNIGYDMLLGALAGGVMGGANAATRAVNYNRLGKTLKKSPAAVQQQIDEGLSKGEGTAPAIYAAEAQKKPTPQMLGRLFEANQSFDAESGLSKIQGDITQLSIRELKAMMNNANAIVQAAETLGVKPTPESVMTEVFSKQKEAAVRTAQDGVGQAFVQMVDNPANAGEVAYNSAIQGAPANQSAAQKVYNDPAARESFAKLAGIEYTGNPAADIAAIEVATKKLGETGRQVVSEAEYTERMTEAAERATAELEAKAEAEADALEQESMERWLSIEQNTDIDVDGKRHVREITNTDVRGNSEISYKKAEIPNSKKPAVNSVEGAAKFLGKTIVWFEGAIEVNGKYRLTNGYRAPDGTIYVNINSRDPLMVTFGHEMFHDLVADSKYSGLIDTLVENPDYADMVKGMMNAKVELYERNGIELDPNAAAEEVAADISGDLLDSRDMLEYIGARNAEAATGIKGFLNRILKKLKGKPSAQEAYNRLSEAQKALLDGMEGRAESTNSAEDASGKHSLMDIPAMDSTGRELSADQREYFFGSKVVDAEGRLKPVYHGSPAVFTEFSPDFMSQHGSSEGQGFYFTDYKPMAEGYQKDGGQLLEGYLDIKKPLSDSEITLTRAEVKKLLQAVDPTGDEVISNYDPSGGIGYPSKTWYNRALDATVKAAMEYSDSDSEILAEIANGGAGAGAVLEAARNTLGYDGYIVEGKYDNATVYVAFDSSQFKNIDNTAPTESKDIRYSLMEDAQYMADIDKAVSEATQKADDELKAAQAEVKELRQQLLDYRQQADAEAKMNERWRDAETKLVADLAAAKEREKAAKARAEFMAKYDALAKQYRADLRANNQQAQEKYNEKLTEAKDEFNRRRTQDRIDRVVREDQAKSKARLRAAEQKSTTTDDVAKVLTEMPKKDKEAFKAKIAESWRTFKRQWINTKDELERFGNEVGDSRIMYAANNVVQAAAAAQYSIGGAGQYDLNGKKIGDKNLMQVFEPAEKAGLTKEFYTYLLHEHNVDRMSVREKAQKVLSAFREELNKKVKGFAEMTDENISTAAGKDTTLTKAYTDEQIAAAKQYKQFQAWAEKQFDKPVFGSSVTAADSRAAADKLLKEHPEFEKWAKDVYAYLDGLMEVRKQGGLVSEDMVQRMKELYPHYVPTYRDMPSTSGGYSNPNSVAVNSTIKSAKGGNQDIMPLIDSIARQTLQAFSAAKKNILGNMLYEDAMDTTRDISEYIQNVTEDGELVDLDADSAETLNNTLRIWVDGKPVTLHMSEAMADGFRPIEQSNSFGMKALRSINSTFKKLVTQWNPVFIVRNFVRDAQSALYFTHYSNATFIKNYGKAVKEIATNGKYWQLYQAMGGKGTTYYDPKTGLSDRHHFKNGAVDKVAGGLNRVIDIISFANEAVEQYPRLAEFISTMEDTGDVQQALYNAADITTNFGRGGFAARKLNASLVPFFNPGMQGLSKNIRNVIDRRGWKEIGQLISRLLINGVTPGIIMSLLFDGLKEDDDYKELSNYIKDSNILIKIGDDKFIKIPMGREPSVITAFTNRMWRWLKGEPASSAFAEYPSFAIEQLAPNNPLTNNIFAGITAMSTNKTWYGGDIVSSYMEEKPDYLQYDESTDAFSIWLGEITRHGKNGIEGLSPKKVNYLIDQYSGFIGDWVLPALSKKADVPAVVKAFVVDSVRQNRLGSDFYDALADAKAVNYTEEATAADKATYSYLLKQSKAASDITKQLKALYDSGEKTRNEKREEARDLLELRNEIYRNALLTVGTYEETAKSIDSADSDVVKREANRKAFGAEYALNTYNKDVGEKAAEYVAQGVTYDQYYAAYFAARGITGDKDENGKTITNSASRKKKEAIDKAVPGATTKQKHLLYEALGVSEKVW